MKHVLLFSLFIVLACVLSAGAQPPTQQNLVPAQSATVPGPPVDMSKAKGYQLGPGDEITVTVVGEPDFNFAALVNDDGKMDLPFEDEPFNAQCKTARQLRADMKTVLGKYLRNPQFSLRVTAQNSRPPVTIYGAVNIQQPVKLMRKARLLELLATSGGVKEEAGGTIQIFRTQEPICAEDDKNAHWAALSNDPTDVPSRLFSLDAIRSGKEDANPVIYPGDVIIVQGAAPVYITGEVNASQGIYLKEGGTTLTEAIAKVGGVHEGAKKDVKIYRLKPDSKDREVVLANLDEIKTGRQKDLLLKPYDIVEVDKAKPGLGRTLLDIAMGAGKGVVSTMSTTASYRVLY